MKYIITEQCLAYRFVEVEAESEDEAKEKWWNGEANPLPDEEPEIDIGNGEITTIFTEEEWKRRWNGRGAIYQ